METQQLVKQETTSTAQEFDTQMAPSMEGGQYSDFSAPQQGLSQGDMPELKKDYLEGEGQLGQPMVDHSVHAMPQSYDMHSAEKLKGNTAATISTNPSLTQSGQRDPEQKRRGPLMDTPLSELSLINPLLYKPASKPPVIKEGDWLCPDSTVCIGW